MELFTKLESFGFEFLKAKVTIKLSKEDAEKLEDVKKSLGNLAKGVNQISDSLNPKRIKSKLAEMSKEAKKDSIFFGLLTLFTLVLLIILTNLSFNSDILSAIINTLEVLLTIFCIACSCSLIVFYILKSAR